MISPINDAVADCENNIIAVEESSYTEKIAIVFQRTCHNETLPGFHVSIVKKIPEKTHGEGNIAILNDTLNSLIVSWGEVSGQEILYVQKHKGQSFSKRVKEYAGTEVRYIH